MSYMELGYKGIWAKLIAIFIMLNFRVTVARCPFGYIEFQSSCYLFADNASETWLDARALCRSNGGDLAEINSTKETLFIKEEVWARSQGKEKYSAYWIGGTDSVLEQRWIWNRSGDVISYNDWHIDQPNNYDNQDCLSLLKMFQFKWNDAKCERRYSFICEGTYFDTSTVEQTTEFQKEKELTTMDGEEMNSTVQLATTSLKKQCTLFCIKTESLEKIESTIEALRLVLSINKTNTSRYRRSLTSADDKRQSARNMGYFGIVVIVCVMCTVVAMDIIIIVNCKYLYRRRGGRQRRKF